MSNEKFVPCVTLGIDMVALTCGWSLWSPPPPQPERTRLPTTNAEATDQKFFISLLLGCFFDKSSGQLEPRLKRHVSSAIRCYPPSSPLAVSKSSGFVRCI